MHSSAKKQSRLLQVQHGPDTALMDCVRMGQQCRKHSAARTNSAVVWRKTLECSNYADNGSDENQMQKCETHLNFQGES